MQPIPRAGEAGSEMATASPDLSFRSFYNVEGAPFVQTSLPLMRAFTAVGLSDAAKVTFDVLWLEWGNLSLKNGHVTPEGEVHIWPSFETIGLRRGGLSERTISRHVAELEKVGALRVVRYSGRKASIFLFRQEELVRRLHEREDVRKRLDECFDSKVISLDDYRADKNVRATHDKNVGQEKREVREQRKSPGSATGAAAGEESREEFLAWLDEEKMRTHDRLWAKVVEVKQATEKAREEERNKPAHRKLNRGKKAKDSGLKREDDARHLLEYLRTRVKDGLSSPIQPRVTLEELSKMKMLREAHGAELVRAVIDWITVPENWELVRSQLKLTKGIPTPGVLLAFDSSIFPMALSGGKRRSGGAEMVDVTTGEDPNFFA